MRKTDPRVECICSSAFDAFKIHFPNPRATVIQNTPVYNTMYIPVYNTLYILVLYSYIGSNLGIWHWYVYWYGRTYKVPDGYVKRDKPVPDGYVKRDIPLQHWYIYCESTLRKSSEFVVAHLNLITAMVFSD
jgi:hypothetical protein